MQFDLPSGHVISLSYLEQRRTYAAAISGRGAARGNGERIARLLDEAAERLPWLGEVHLLPARLAARGPLPTVTTLAEFVSNAPANDPGEAFSSAAFLWFQADFGLDDEQALDALRRVDWPALAVDWSP